MSTHTKPLILLVEDDDDDYFFTARSLKNSPAEFDLVRVVSGEDALEFLEDQRPDLILMDLNLPYRSGNDVLDEIKKHPDWRRIPVVVLTSSKAESDILRSHNLHCNSYMIKPAELDVLHSMMRSLGDYWFNTVTLSPR